MSGGWAGGRWQAGQGWALHAVIVRTQELGEGLRDLREVFQVGYDLQE